MDHYGWLNEDDVNPTFTGYAMWAMNPPYDHDFDAWQADVPPSRAPTEAEQRLMELGHDFFGLMKTARHFIGYRLLHQPAVEPLGLDPTDFDFSEFAALVALTASGDRLRDFVIVTTLGKKTDEMSQLQQAYGMLRGVGLGSQADALEKGFRTVRNAREARHTAAHGLATQPARVQRQLIVRDRSAFEEKRWRHPNSEQGSFENQIREAQRAETDELKEVQARARLLCENSSTSSGLEKSPFAPEYEWRHRNSRPARNP